MVKRSYLEGDEMDARVHEIARALADPLRLAVLEHLMSGPATVSELVSVTGESQSKISNHLALMRASGLVRAAQLGRQRIYELRDASVGQLVESLMAVAGASAARRRPSPPLAQARTCYDHLAGRLGVALFDALLARDAIKQAAAAPQGLVELGPASEQVFGTLGLALDDVRRERRRFAYACLDWTERRPHLGGALGAALWAKFMARGWVLKQPSTRAMIVTEAGRRNLRRKLNIRLDN
jgi:DNA-binding transcriptional ArsR family regulator